MNGCGTEGNLYTIGHAALCSGLTERTIRRYISAGILQGEKINGMWHFTLEQLEAFFSHPTAKVSILAAKNALIYDFLRDDFKQNEQSCMILDFPKRDPKEVAEFFCYAINEGGYSDIRFALDSQVVRSRVFLKGKTADVMELVNRFYER